MGSDILGSTLNHHSAESSSIICAYWPTHGSTITDFSASKINIGQVTSHFSHKITVMNRATFASDVHHYIMARVCWMCDHHQSSRYGISAVVCSNSFWEPSLCSYIPVARIYGKCASCLVNIDNEVVYVACPIPIKHCI